MILVENGCRLTSSPPVDAGDGTSLLGFLQLGMGQGLLGLRRWVRADGLGNLGCYGGYRWGDAAQGV
ncbi:hypothetical protein ACLOJK_037294 [Asimina triloba]